MFKAVVFDLDGTLIDSPLCLKSVRHELGIPQGEYIIEHLETQPDQIRREKLIRLEEIEVHAASQAVAFNGVTTVLSQLKSRGIKTGIFTRNCRAATERATRSLGIQVDRVMTREDAPAKPDPTGLKLLLEHWSLEPQDLLFVGDFRFDIECGRKAGVKTALFRNKLETDEDWGPDLQFDDYAYFIELIGP